MRGWEWLIMKVTRATAAAVLFSLLVVSSVFIFRMIGTADTSTTRVHRDDPRSVPVITKVCEASESTMPVKSPVPQPVVPNLPAPVETVQSNRLTPLRTALREKFGCYEDQPLALKETFTNDELDAVTEFLTPYIERDPPAPLRVTQNPEAISEDSAVSDCELTWPTAFGGAKTKKVVDIIIFASDLDLLEIRLHELDAVVDLFVLVEGTRTRKGRPKQLFYARNKARFAKFSHKIIYVVQDDAELVRLGTSMKPNERAIEPETLAFIKRKVMRALEQQTLDDWFAHFSDLDEIPSYPFMWCVRHARIRPRLLHAVLHFSMNNLRTVFSDPQRNKGGQIFRLADYKDEVRLPFRNSGAVRVMTPPVGLHMSDYCYFPSLLYKHMTFTHAGSSCLKMYLYDPDTMTELVRMHSRLGCPRRDESGALLKWAGLQPFLGNINVSYVPWAARYNPDRYPSLFDGGPFRNDD